MIPNIKKGGPHRQEEQLQAKQAAAENTGATAKHGKASDRQLDLRSVEERVSKAEHGHGLQKSEYSSRAGLDPQDRFRQHFRPLRRQYRSALSLHLQRLRCDHRPGAAG